MHHRFNVVSHRVGLIAAVWLVAANVQAQTDLSPTPTTDAGTAAPSADETGTETGGTASAQGGQGMDQGMGTTGGTGGQASPAAQPTQTSTDTIAERTAKVDNAELPPVGDVGIGYFSTSAPLGVRMWMSESVGFDAGLGFSVDSSTQDPAWGLSAEGGLLYALATFDNLIFFARGGVGVGLNDGGTPGQDIGYSFNINGMLAGEFFMTALGFPNLSLTGGIGVQMNLNDPPAGDFGIQFNSVSAPVNLVTSAVLGFHIYL